MEAPSLFVYGTVSLVRSGGSIRRTTSLSAPQFTFGRLSSSDCRLLFETVSKLHARIVVDQQAPYQAVLEVHGVNGLTHNGIVYEKGCHIPLENNDEIIICDRIFRWGSATALEINVDSPPPSQRRAPRQSLISAAQAITPSKPKPSSSSLAPSASPSIFSGLLSPFKSTTSPSTEPREEKERIIAPSPSGEEQEELMSWDERPDKLLDGEKGDLITWDEIEEEEDLVEELEKAAAAEAEAPGTPQQKEPFSMASTPSLANRARSLRPPTSATTQRTIDLTTSSPRSARRRSMRITIVPSSRADEWIRERDEKRREEERVLLEQQQRQQQQEVETPVKEQRARSASPSLIASASSSTSRRISALLLSPAASLSSGSAQDGVEEEEEESSDEEEEEVGLNDYEEEEGDEYGYDADSQPELEKDQVVALAATVPLPESPYNAPTATPADHQSGAPLPSTPTPVAQQLTPVYIPRYSARRHSLREKVLIRSAIKKAITPPLTPVVAPAPAKVQMQVEEPELGEGEVEMRDDFADADGEEEEEEDVIVPVGVRPEDVPLPESPAVSTTPSRPLTPSFSRNTPRDSIDLVRNAVAVKLNSADASRVSKAQALQGAETEMEDDEGSESEEDSEEESNEEEEMEEGGGSPSPAIRFAPPFTFTPSKSPAPAMARLTPALQRAAAVPLPETPAGALNSYTPKPASIGLGAPSTPRTPASMAQTTDSPLSFTASASTSKTPRSIPLPKTPEGARPYAVQEATPEQGGERRRAREMMSTPVREAFRSEMTSPVTGHRLLPTPRSALRSSTKPILSPNARRKSARGFLAPFLPAPPSTKRKSVVFDEQLYIQEIVDIRDKTMHWDEKLDGQVERKEKEVMVESPVQKQSARTSLFASPAPRTPQATIIARANTTPTTSLRKAQRNPHLSASLTASLLKSVSPFALPPVNQGTPRGALFGTPSKSAAAGTPRKAGRVATPARKGGEGSSSTPAVQTTPGSARRKAGKIASAPATPKQPEQQQKQELGASVIANRQAEILQLLATPDSAPSTSADVAPNTSAAPKSTSALIERMEALRRRSLPALQLNFVERTPAKEEEPQETEVIILDDDAVASPSTPTRDLPTTITPAPTPNLSTGLRRLFAAPPAPQATPKFTGLRNLFSIPGSPAQSPHFDGVAEMLRTPAAPEPTLAPTPVNSQPSTLVRASPEQEEQEEEEDEPSIGLNSVDLGSHGVGIEADILAASALKPSFIDEVSPPVSPSPKEREVKVEKAKAELEQEEKEQVKVPEKEQQEEGEEEQIETPEQPIVEERSPVEKAVDVVEEAPIVEETVTRALCETRTTKAATTKKTIRKTVKAVAEREQEHEDSADSEPTPAPAPKRASATKSTRGSTRSTRTAKTPDSDEEAHETPAAPARRSRAVKKVEATVVEEVKAEEEPEEEEVEEVVVAKPTRGRAAKAKVVAEEEIPKPVKRGRKMEPVVEVIVAPARGRRTVAAKKVAEVESSHESEAEVEQVEEKPAPVKKAAPARKGRAAKAPIAVLKDEDEDEESGHATPAPAPARATRGKRAVLEQSSSEDAAPSAAAPAKATRTTRTKAIVELENSAPAAPKARRAPAQKAVKEEEAPAATTGRALRARR